MCSAQLLDFSIFDLAQMEKRTPKDMQRAMRRIDVLLKQPAGDQAKTLGDVDSLLREHLERAVGLRNRLAHDFLIRYRVEKSVNEYAAKLVIAYLASVTAYIDSVQARLDVISDQRRDRRGMQPLDGQELAQMARSLTRWALVELDDTPAPDGDAEPAAPDG